MNQPTNKSSYKHFSRKMLWNGRTIAIVSLAVIIVITVLVLLSLKRSIYDELEITLAIIVFSFFIFLTYGLYNGANIIGKPFFPKLKKVDFSNLDLITDLPDIGVDDGILGIIGAIIAWIALTIIVFVLLTFVFTVLWSAILILAFALYFLFFRALRIVFLKSSLCKNNLVLSLKYSLLYSFLYTGWIFGIIISSKYFAQRGL